MNKVKTVNKLYKELKEEIKDDFTEEEKAACIMKKIAEERSFSSKYYWANKTTREKIYRKAINNKTKIEKNKKQLICVTTTKIFMELAKKFNLDVYVIGDKDMTKDNFKIFNVGEHVSPVIKTKDGRFIKTDVEWNFENIKTGRKWLNFGTKDEKQTQLEELTEEEIDNILIKIGYIRNKEDYLENYLKSMDLKNKNIKIKDRIDKVFNDNKIQEKVKKMDSSVDIYRFYRRILKEEISKENIVLFGGYSSKKSKDLNKYTIITYLKQDEKESQKSYFWIWSSRKKKMVSIEDRILKLMLEKNMINVVPGKKENKYKEMLENLQNTNKINVNKQKVLSEIWLR